MGTDRSESGGGRAIFRAFDELFRIFQVGQQRPRSRRLALPRHEPASNRIARLELDLGWIRRLRIRAAIGQFVFQLHPFKSFRRSDAQTKEPALPYPIAKYAYGFF